MEVATRVDIEAYPMKHRGKVRDVYELSPESLLIVATDRISAYDVVMEQPVPYRGVILNKLTLFWMEMFNEVVRNHILASEPEDFPAPLQPGAAVLDGRAVVARKAEALPIECIVRGHITGSGWKDYLRTGEVCGQKLPAGLRESEKLEEPLFTPSTKAGLGEHDENITLERAIEMLGRDVFDKARDLSLELFTRGREYAENRGVIIADTKFEFGLIDGELVLIDEVLTPDSSRFWPLEGYAPGRSQPSFDKQFLRDWLSAQDWDKQPPPPDLPDEIVMLTMSRYVEAYEKLTGERLPFVEEIKAP